MSTAAQKYCDENQIDPKTLRGQGLITLPLLKKGSLGRVESVGKAKAAEIAALTQGQSGNLISSLTVQFNSEKILAALKEAQGLSESLLPVILHEFSQLLSKEPKFTSFYEDSAIHYYDQVNLGVALDLGQGLKVVTIQKADRLSPLEISEKLLDFSIQYASHLLQLNDLENSTVTVTDLSGLNILSFQPLLNQYQSVILGIGGDQTLPGKPVSLTLAFDHRVLTGREVGTFLSNLRARLLAKAVG